MQQTMRRWDPWREFNQLQGEVNRLFQRHWGAAPGRSEYPAINLWHNAESVVLVSEIPGINPDELDVMVHGDTVTIRGKRTAEPLKEGETYLRRERPSAEFTRVVELPFEVDSQQTEATCKDGVLTLTLHRPEEHRPRKVAVRRGS